MIHPTPREAQARLPGFHTLLMHSFSQPKLPTRRRQHHLILITKVLVAIEVSSDGIEHRGALEVCIRRDSKRRMRVVGQ